MIDPVRRDIFDASLGSHAKVTSTGRVAVLIVMEPHAAKIISDSQGYLDDHGCQGAIAALSLLGEQHRHLTAPLYKELGLANFEPYRH